MYQLQNGSQTSEFETREEAVDAAKNISSETRQAIYVVDPDEREKLTYQGGSLESYTYEIRGGRRR